MSDYNNRAAVDNYDHCGGVSVVLLVVVVVVVVVRDGNC